MRSEPAAMFQPLQSTSSTYRVSRRPSATFLVLGLVAGVGPEPGTFAGEIEIARFRAPCGITVLDQGLGGEVWCRPRGPLPLAAVGDQVILRFAPPRSTNRR